MVEKLKISKRLGTVKKAVYLIRIFYVRILTKPKISRRIRIRIHLGSECEINADGNPGY